MAGRDLTLKIRRTSKDSAARVGDTFVLRADRAIVGRSPDCDFVIDDITVSRRHAELTRERDGVWIRNLAENNGTFVDGRKLKPDEKARLDRERQRLQLGGVLLDLSSLAGTRPVNVLLESGSLRRPSGAFAEPFFLIEWDGDSCAVTCKGRFLDIHAAAARALSALCAKPGQLVHEWDIQDVVGGPCNVQQLMSTVRRGMRLLVENGSVSDEELRAHIRRHSAGEHIARLDEMTTEELLRRFVKSRRGHGYLICLSESEVKIRRQ